MRNNVEINGISELSIELSFHMIFIQLSIVVVFCSTDFLFLKKRNISNKKFPKSELLFLQVYLNNGI